MMTKPLSSAEHARLVQLAGTITGARATLRSERKVLDAARHEFDVLKDRAIVTRMRESGADYQTVSKAAGKGAILSLGMGPAWGLRGC